MATQTFNGSNTSSRSVLAVQCVNGARSIPSRPTYNPLLYHTRASGTDLRTAAIHAIRLFVHAVPSFQRSMTRSSLGSLQRNRGAPSRTPCPQREGRNVALSPATTMRTSARRSGASPPSEAYPYCGLVGSRRGTTPRNPLPGHLPPLSRFSCFSSRLMLPRQAWGGPQLPN